MASRKGSPNKISGQARENIAAVFTRLGGTAAMAEWAAENKSEFYKLYARLVPVEQRLGNPDGTALAGTLIIRNA
jgi:hypothetical protein